ncbi:AMP-dependent synthetase/ligase [Gonapodya prolifera JEL478]|uniref:AMP-dependent synthetase/ligase n=1 Tax=Gonapodya prolifera (strain JEL478) TaxID=1344416 RepID=A0A139ARK1_GONPJ|nr:AMP-dependent synthetase/ligase [Gonapodya prolifera JEL478]|eukprot:KXS19329.1 AMP-dependent synthetase/ligase [Gonapodya prolifera JEL478]
MQGSAAYPVAMSRKQSAVPSETATLVDDRERLTELVNFVRDKSPFYRELYAKVPKDNIALTDLPILDHGAFWDANTLHGNTVLTDTMIDGTIYKSGGTTASPKWSFYTRTDSESMARVWAQGLISAGLRAGDIVANLFYGGELYASFTHNVFSTHFCPVPVIHLGIGRASPESIVDYFREHQPTVVLSTVTTLCLVAELVAKGEQIKSVDLILFAGEAFFEDQRQVLLRAFPNAKINSCGYASVEGGILGIPVSSSSDPRVHRVPTWNNEIEIIDPDTGAVITQPGIPGRLVVTSLTRRLMPVIRYPAGDVAEWVDYEGAVFRLLGRDDHGVRMGPVTIYWNDFRLLLSELFPEMSTTGIQLVLRRKNAMDELTLRVVGSPPDKEAARKAIEDGLARVRPFFKNHVDMRQIAPLAVEWVKEVSMLKSNARSGKLMLVVDDRALNYS